MNKIDMVLKVAMVALLMVIAYQQRGMQEQLAGLPRESGFRTYDVLNVRVVNKEDEKMPVSVSAERGKFGEQPLAVDIKSLSISAIPVVVR